jgi:tetratricopeptide (TPR) repeat protein
LPPESPRIAELRRRVEADPSSIAFAQLAEEYRRVGNFEAAEQCCRTGLTRHPGYLSARVTLGRTLIELNKLEDAEQELDFVLKSAPDNLAAIRGMAEIHQRRGQLESALDFYRRALPLARHDPEIEENVRQIRRDLAAAKPALQSPGLSFKEAQEEFLAALSRLPLAVARPAPIPAPPASPPLPDPKPLPEPDPVVDAPPAPVAVDVDAPIDFDGLLRTLGVPDHQPPPVVEALITELAAPAAPLDAAERRASASARSDNGAEEEILDELEAWLAAIRR